jgi:serine/threonine-protein kinase
MGGVYLAVHTWTGERVALKVLDLQYAGHPEVVERLLAEHALASRVRHPGIVDIRGSYWTDDHVPYLVMEYLAGETLGAIAERGALDLPLILSICAQAAAALAALHAAGVIHCDVKHDNLFVLDQHVGGWPRVKVIDFGVSRLIDEPPRDDPSVAERPGASRPSSGAAIRDRQRRLALGCLLYDLTTGHPPFDGSLPELMAAHLGDDRRDRRAEDADRARAPDPAPARQGPVVRPAMRDVAVELGALADDYVAEPAPPGKHRRSRRGIVLTPVFD